MVLMLRCQETLNTFALPLFLTSMVFLAFFLELQEALLLEMSVLLDLYTVRI